MKKESRNPSFQSSHFHRWPLLVLASASPYRKKQLQTLGLEFESHPHGIDEEHEKKVICKKTKSPNFVQICEHLAWKKASHLQGLFPKAVIIGGDQMLEFQGKMMGKPFCFEKALHQLQMLSGETHRLLTSVCVLYDKRVFLHTERACLSMRRLSREDLEAYIRKDQPLDCCGSYRIEKSGITLFHKIQCEDFSALIGLPLIFITETFLRLKMNPFLLIQE